MRSETRKVSGAADQIDDVERIGAPGRVTAGPAFLWAELARLVRRGAERLAVRVSRGRAPSAPQADAVGMLEEQLGAATRQIEAITEKIRTGFAAMADSEQRRCALACSEFMRAARGAIDPLLFWPLPHGHFEYEWLKDHAHRETLTFYTDIWEVVFDEACKIGKPNVRILDAGCGCGIGSELLGILLRNAPGIRCEITANDAFDNFAPYIRAHFDAVKFDVGLVQDIPEKYDIVVCSHLIEHFDDPFPFIEELHKRASDAVILYAPFEEEPRIYGHFYTFREPDLVRMGARFHKVITSKAWHGKCFVAVLDGSGPEGSSL
jgi:2-polyprenyl-3-methyl-5-hydroxy-6-metoxy-1,4-benzoquinol methylase